MQSLASICQAMLMTVVTLYSGTPEQRLLFRYSIVKASVPLDRHVIR